MGRLSRRIDDKTVLRLIPRYLVAGILDGGMVMARYEGTPQGGPLSPLLANVLDEVDRELEGRGHRFVRYADVCNVYVSSQWADERVLTGQHRLYDRPHLKVNEAKTAVAPATYPAGSGDLMHAETFTVRNLGGPGLGLSRQ